jgi:hypothetical protein
MADSPNSRDAGQGQYPAGAQVNSGMGAQFGVSQGGYGAYQSNPDGTYQGIGVNTTPHASEGAGGVFRVDPLTGRISQVPVLATSYGAAGTGTNNPAYGTSSYYQQQQLAPGAYQNFDQGYQAWLAAGGRAAPGQEQNTAQAIAQGGRYGAQTAGNLDMARREAYAKSIGAWGSNGLSLQTVGGGLSGTGGTGTGTSSGLEGLAAMGQRRLGEQASEQNERLAEDYQRRGMTQSGLLGEAQARQTRDQGYALADFLAQLYGRQQNYGSSNIQSLSASNRGEENRGPTDQQDLQSAYMNMMQGQQLDPSLQALLAQLFGGGGTQAGGPGGGYLDSSGLFVDPTVAAMSGNRDPNAGPMPGGYDAYGNYLGGD